MHVGPGKFEIPKARRHELADIRAIRFVTAHVGTDIPTQVHDVLNAHEKTKRHISGMAQGIIPNGRIIGHADVVWLIVREAQPAMTLDTARLALE